MNLFLSFGQMNCTSLPPLTLTWTSEKLALRAGSIVQSPKLILRLLCVNMWGGRTIATFLDVQQQIAQFPDQPVAPNVSFSRSLGPPPHPERHSSFCAARDLTFDTARVKLDQIIHTWASERLLLHITFHPLLGPSDCRANVQRHKRSYFPSCRCLCHHHHSVATLPGFQEATTAISWPSYEVSNQQPWTCADVRVTWLVPGGDGRYFLPLWSLFLEYRI